MSKFQVEDKVAVVALEGSEHDDWFVVPASILSALEVDSKLPGGYTLEGFGKVTSITGEKGSFLEDKGLPSNNGLIIVNEYIQCKYDENVINKITGA